MSQVHKDFLYCPFCLMEGILKPIENGTCLDTLLGGHGTKVQGLELSWNEVQFIALNYVLSSASKKDLEIGVKLALSGRNPK